VAGNNLNSDRRYSKNKSKRLEITEQQLLTTAGTSATALDRNHNNNNEDYEKEQLMPQLEKVTAAAVTTTAEEDVGGSENPLTKATTRKWSPRGCEKCDSVRHRHPLHRKSENYYLSMCFRHYYFLNLLLLYLQSTKSRCFLFYVSLQSCRLYVFFLSDIPALIVIAFSNFGHPYQPTLYCKKRLSIFPSPAWMSLTKLSLAGNNLIIREFGK
jgi:hypothetical protein